MAKQANKKKQGAARAAARPAGRWARHVPGYERLLFGVALLGGLTTVHLMLTAGTNFEQDCLFGAFEAEAAVSGCQAAMESAVGAPLGVSNAVWGGLFYLVIALLGAAVALGPAVRRPQFKQARAALLGAGFLYSLFLTVYQFVVLPARCPLCLLSALLVTVLLAVQALYVFKPIDSSAIPMTVQPKKREGLLYGALAVLALFLIGADAVYFDTLDTPAAVQPAQAQVAGADAADMQRECRYDPDKARVAPDILAMLVDERDPQFGNLESPVTLIEFFDPNCPHCKRLHPIVKATQAAYADKVRFVYKPIWLPQFRASVLQNAVLFAADEEGKFEAMLDLQFERQQGGGLTGTYLKELAAAVGMDEDAMEARIKAGDFNDLVQRGNQQAINAGLTGVPAILINGRFVAKDSRTEACLSRFLDAELENTRAEG